MQPAMQSLSARIALVAAAILLAGCEAKIYRAETTLKPDGSVSRAIYQPAAGTPTAAVDDARWSNLTYAPRVAHKDWIGPISDLPPQTSDKDHPYLAAWGDFASVDQLPKTFLAEGPVGVGDGELKRRYSRNDYVLVVEHQWSERLTDVVSLADLRRAQNELADLLIPLVERIFNKALEQEYDTSAFVAWMQTKARPLAFELIDVYFDLLARGDSPSGELVVAGLVPVFARHGISLIDAEGKPLADKALQHAIAEHLREVLRKTIRNRSGKPLPEDVIKEVMQWTGLEQTPEGAEVPRRFAEAAQRSIEEEFGSQDAFSAKTKPLLARIFGLYGPFTGGNARTFNYRLQMPGKIVDTSGDLLAENVTRWEFSDGDAYPFGYEMRSRSLEEKPEVAEKLVGAEFLADRAKVLAYVELVRKSERLLNIMRKCAAAEDITPLVRARATAAPGSEAAAEYGELLELLRPGESK
jgi:hypothetical protein